jgi:hypothetical protein
MQDIEKELKAEKEARRNLSKLERFIEGIDSAVKKVNNNDLLFAKLNDSFVSHSMRMIKDSAGLIGLNLRAISIKKGGNKKPL